MAQSFGIAVSKIGLHSSDVNCFGSSHAKGTILVAICSLELVTSEAGYTVERDS